MKLTKEVRDALQHAIKAAVEVDDLLWKARSVMSELEYRLQNASKVLEVATGTADWQKRKKRKLPHN